MQGLVIAGTHSGCGKTTVTLGILAALKKKGLEVQSFKAGPDFIDAGLHRIITDRPSRNLDIWICGEDYVKNYFLKYSRDVDISVIEGVMGMYDGEFSTARLASLLNLPVILIVDAYGMAESARAVVRGFVDYGQRSTVNSQLSFLGVIFNRVASENHYKRLKNSVHDIPVLGYLPRDLSFEIPHRHLGLTVAEENPITEEAIQKLADTVLKYIDVDMIVRSSARPASRSEVGEFRVQSNYSFDIFNSKLNPEPDGSGQNSKLFKIAIAYDKAFCFYYEDNLDLLKDEGAEIVTFSPLSDTEIPDEVDVIYIGGGYPELYASALSNNKSMLNAIHTWTMSGMPIYAECGGLMYLSKGIYDFDGNFYKMAGVFPFKTKMTKTRPNLGYREILLKEDCVIGKKGEKYRGHEFHYSEIKDSFKFQVSGFKSKNSELSHIYYVKNGSGQNVQDEGYRFKNTIASYVHVHFGSNPNIAKAFVNFFGET